MTWHIAVKPVMIIYIMWSVFLGLKKNSNQKNKLLMIFNEIAAPVDMCPEIRLAG